MKGKQDNHKNILYPLPFYPQTLTYQLYSLIHMNTQTFINNSIILYAYNMID